MVFSSAMRDVSPSPAERPGLPRLPCLGAAGMDAGMLVGKRRRRSGHIGARPRREITGHTALQTPLHPAEAISRSDGSGHVSRRELHPASRFYRITASTPASPPALHGLPWMYAAPTARRWRSYLRWVPGGDPAAVAAGTAERGRDSPNHLLEDQLRRPGLGIPSCGLPAPGGGGLRPYAS